MTYRNQRGSSHLVLLVLVFVVVAIGLIGVRVLNHQNVTTASTTPAPAAIKSSTDIDQASKSLDGTAIDSSLNTDNLDKDLSTVL